jgi:Carbamoylphosphate synthase large subunit (split gene in MJ)
MSDQMIPTTRNFRKPIRIYFNRCFSTTSKIIQRFLTVPNEHKFEIFISHGCVNKYLKEISDYFEVEPILSGKDYVYYCLNFCLKHKIDLFVPRFNVTTLVNFKEAFDRIGVKVMFVGSPATYQLLDNKVKTYEALKDSDIVGIPKTFCIKNYHEFKRAYKEITETGSRTCMKPISGIGGNGFKIISETMTEIDELYQSTGSTITKDRLERILQDVQNVEPFVVMEYLEGDEFSIDCLANNGELIRAIPRRKLDFYCQNVEYRADLITIAQKLTKKFNLNYLYNIQLKYHKGKVYLIEINSRMSGGIHKSSLAGVNFLYLAIKLLMGEPLTTEETVRWNFQIRAIENYKLTDLG